MVDVSGAWDAGYTGKGVLVAVIDTGLDMDYDAKNTYDDSVSGNAHIKTLHEAFTENSFKTEDGKTEVKYTSDAMTKFISTYGSKLKASIRGVGNELYKNSKVPFAYDYADSDVNVQAEDSDHGTHVAGLIAGYATDSDGAIKFSGIAPDAQLAVMKVFGASNSASEHNIINAIEDAALLGADVINLSLGSVNGYTDDDSLSNQAYQSLHNAGIIFMVAAGNDGYSSTYNNYSSSYGLASDPDISMISSPAVYDSTIGVASIDNGITSASTLSWSVGDTVYGTAQFYDYTGRGLKKAVGDTAISVIDAGSGTYKDFLNAGFSTNIGSGKTGIALVQRGSLDFKSMLKYAANFTWKETINGETVTGGILGVIVYDNINETRLYGVNDGSESVQAAFISKSAGDSIVTLLNAGNDVKITVNSNDTVFTTSKGGKMSSFSSWGTSPSLELKPDITAPGGNIWSSIVGSSYSEDGTSGTYGLMSGTSMATPHMTGIAALVKQYVMERFGNDTNEEESVITDDLMVSTAIPQKDTNGAYYSPRLQGAGLVNAAAAVTTPAYITVTSQPVGKLELMDDAKKTGSYDLKFNVVNISSSTLTYNMTAVVMRPDTTTTGKYTLMTTSDVIIKTVDLGSVTVAANSKTAVSKNITLSDAEKSQIDALFANGTYIEGYIILKPTNGTDPQIGLPFLAFYGDWTAAPIFDHTTWLDSSSGIKSTWGTSTVGYYNNKNKTYALMGQNPFDPNVGTNQT
jgi:subtilisin family serine protease